jgi:hypothetical protein
MISIPASGTAALLNVILDPNFYWYHLYTNEVFPGDVETSGDFTEADFPGYEAQQAKSWTDAATVAGCTYSVADPVLWTCSADTEPALMYGYFVTMGESGPLIWWEPRPTGPVRIASKGDQVEAFPRLTLAANPLPC